ncbi:MAG: hypothetical protein E7632_13045 [Ruminococcaceae bacterium]|nr:hypothetical protein [Oscillospiraceae bacterium]
MIVRSDLANEATVAASISLRKTIEASTGVKLDMATDWVKKGEEVPVGTKEILVGSTNRPESGEMRYMDYEIKYEGSRVVINGGSAEAVQTAVDWFLENCVGDEIRVPETAYLHEESYPYANATIEGIPLREFALMEREASICPELAEWLAKGTGFYPEKRGEHLILMNESDALRFDEASISMRDGNLMLEAGTNSGSIAHVAELFKESVTAGNGGEITLLGKVELEMKQIEGNAAAMIAQWRAESDARIAEILASPNMEIPADARVFYLSPNGDDAADGRSPETAWKTLAKLNGAGEVIPGSYVCFERGGLWRGQLKAKTGVTYTAYGEGAKPTLYGSPLDGADASLWTKTDTENIWVFAEAWDKDVGTLIFDHGEAHGIKCVIRTEADGSTFNNTTGEVFNTYADLTTDLHFYHDYAGSGKLYLYSEGNPGARFDSIEFNIKQNVIAIAGSGITIDNFCIKYGGAHGVGAGTVSNLTVQNCEFGWIGGSIQSEGIYGRNYGTRYGNAVEIYGGCDTYTVTDNYIYQIYDAAITQQFTVSNADEVKHQKNMTYARNVIEYCNYSIEYFLGLPDKENPSRMENFLIEDNYMWNAGYGFCEQRPDHDQGAHIKGWSGGNRNRATGYIIRNNVMCHSRDMLVQITSHLLNPDGSDSMPKLSGNHFVGKIGGQFGTIAMDTVRQAYNPAIVDYIGEKSDGTDTFWME